MHSEPSTSGNSRSLWHVTMPETPLWTLFWVTLIAASAVRNGWSHGPDGGHYVPIAVGSVLFVLLLVTNEGLAQLRTPVLEMGLVSPVRLPYHRREAYRARLISSMITRT
jgi:hypothetical protein